MAKEKTINGRKLFDLRRLQACGDFQSAIASDPVIKAAFRDKRETRAEQIGELLAALGGNCEIGGKCVFPPPPPGVIALLSIIESPYLYPDKPLTPEAVEAALHVLIYGREAFDMIRDLDGELAAAARETFELLDLGYTAASKGVDDAVSQAFNAFGMIRGAVSTDEKRYYDAYWLAGICAQVADVGNLPLHEIIWDLPMVMAGFLIVQKMRLAGDKRIARRTPSYEAMLRLEQLIDEWLPKATGRAA